MVTWGTPWSEYYIAFDWITRTIAQYEITLSNPRSISLTAFSIGNKTDNFTAQIKPVLDRFFNFTGPASVVETKTKWYKTLGHCVLCVTPTFNKGDLFSFFKWT